MSLILSLSIATFLVLLLVQAAVWSVVRVRREMLGLVVIYAVVPAVLAGATAFWSGVEGLSLAAAGIVPMSCGPRCPPRRHPIGAAVVSFLRNSQEP